MGTRSQIILVDKNKNKIVTFYRHYDGYPAAVLRDLIDSIQKYDTEFSIHGGSIEQVRDGKRFSAKRDMISNWDIEWSYIVDLTKKTVSVSAGDFEIGPIDAYYSKRAYRSAKLCRQASL